MSTQRQPFQVPSGCTPITFDINIVPPDFTFCSTPPFTRSTGYPRSYPFPPIVIPPIDCVCIPTMFMSTRATHLISGNKLTFDIRVIPKTTSATRDCCSPNFEISYNLQIPCFPITVNKQNKITFDVDSDQRKPVLDIKISKMPDCSGLQFSYDLKVPCFPATFKVSGISTTITGGGFNFKLEGNKEPNCSGLNLKYSFNFDPLGMSIPCMPAKLTHTKPTVFTWPAKFSKPKFTFILTKLPNCSGLRFSYDFKIPCFPATVNVTSKTFAWPTKFSKPMLDIKITKLPECSGLKFSYDFKIPCFPASVAVTKNTFVWPVQFTKPKLDFKVTKLPDCSGLRFSYNLAIPCFPNKVDVVGAFNENALLPNTFAFAITKLPGCSGLRFSYKINLNYGNICKNYQDYKYFPVTYDEASKCLKVPYCWWVWTCGREPGRQAAGHMTVHRIILCGESCPSAI